MAHYTPPPFEPPSKVALWEPSLGRLELGDLPFVVESFQIGSPDIRENVKNRSLMDGVFDDTVYHGASVITINTRLANRSNYNEAGRLCGPTPYGIATLRDTLVAYANPRLRPRLYWRYPNDGGPTDGADMGDTDDFGQWATVRGASWPFVIDGPKYPTLAVQFKNPLGKFYLGDPEAAPHTATAFPGSEADGRTYDLTFDRDYPDVITPAGTAIIHNNGNSYADWKLEVHGPFDAGATVVITCPCGTVVPIEFNEALLVNEFVTLLSLNKTILHNNGLSYYPYTNFGDWSWEQVRLSHGDSYMTFDGEDGGDPSGWATIEWYSTSI